jgi:putative transposase
LKQRIREIAETRNRYVYLRIHTRLSREGWPINHKRIYRLYGEMGLQMRHKTPRRRVKAKLGEDRQPTERTDDCWSMDFMVDQLFDGRKLRVLTIVDNFSRVSPANRGPPSVHGIRCGQNARMGNKTPWHTPSDPSR